MVVFEGGGPKKSDYRRFKIRDGGPGRLRRDGRGAFAADGTVRRQRERSPHERAYDASFASAPALIVIDGGKGQLVGARGALGSSPTWVSPSSRSPSGSRRSTCPGSASRSVLPRDSPALQLLQRVRDEAHRFAIEYHRNRRDRR